MNDLELFHIAFFNTLFSIYSALKKLIFLCLLMPNYESPVPLRDLTITNKNGSYQKNLLVFLLKILDITSGL